MVIFFGLSLFLYVISRSYRYTWYGLLLAYLPGIAMFLCLPMHPLLCMLVWFIVHQRSSQVCTREWHWHACANANDTPQEEQVDTWIVWSDAHWHRWNRMPNLDDTLLMLYATKAKGFLWVGDMVDGPLDHRILTWIKTVNSHIPIYYVSGNHEKYNTDPWKDALVKYAGIHWLDNQNIDCGGYVVEGLPFGTKYHVIERTEGTIVLRHDPEGEVVARGNVLILSGHYHGGQMWPVTLWYRWTKGYIDGGRSMGAISQIISRGLGVGGPMIRFLCSATEEKVYVHYKRAIIPYDNITKNHSMDCVDNPKFEMDTNPMDE